MFIHYYNKYIPMDEKLIKLILQSCEDSLKEIQDFQNDTELVDFQKLSSNPTILANALSKSFTNLLCYKVSVEAHQRYSVRLNLIGVLRNLCQTTGHYKHLRLFSNHQKTFMFVKTVVEKYLTDDVLKNCYNPNTLNTLINPLLNYIPQDFSFQNFIENLIHRLTQLEATRESEVLLLHVLNNHQTILKLSTIERIYTCLMDTLVVEPLTNHFASTCKDCTFVTNPNYEDLLHQLIQFSAKSALIFQTVMRFLTELLIHLDYSQNVVDFIQSILNSITNNCVQSNKDIIDLYPQNLQFSIVLLKIEPSYHTPGSREYTLNVLRDFFIQDKTHAILLLTHFPLWLELFFTHVNVDHCFS